LTRNKGDINKMNGLTIHRVKKIEVFNGVLTGELKEKSYYKTFTFTDDKGIKFEIVAFADEKNDLEGVVE